MAFEGILERIRRSAGTSRLPELQIVTKTIPQQRILDLLARVDCTGILLGENRVQEAREKPVIRKFAPLHLIGHLQRNKAKLAVHTFDGVDSVDSAVLACKLADFACAAGIRLPVLLQVNTSGEASKSGVAPGDTMELAAKIAGLDGLNLQGLMTIGAHTPDEKTVRLGFAAARRILEDLRSGLQLPLPVLSMGMSGDLEWAVAEGSTRVRIGSAIFGAR